MGVVGRSVIGIKLSARTNTQLPATNTHTCSSNLPGLPEHSITNSHLAECSHSFDQHVLWWLNLSHTIKCTRTHTKLPCYYSSEGSKVRTKLHRLIHRYVEVMHMFIELRWLRPPYLSKLAWSICIRTGGLTSKKTREREEREPLSLRADSGCVYARMHKRRRDEKSDNSPATLRPLAASQAPYRSPDTCLSRKPGPTNWPLW